AWLDVRRTYIIIHRRLFDPAGPENRIRFPGMEREFRIGRQDIPLLSVYPSRREYLFPEGGCQNGE
ncbi:MAG: hypothetical protein ACRDHW_11965, partial [Ktedonobacteraceae bacterium]